MKKMKILINKDISCIENSLDFLFDKLSSLSRPFMEEDSMDFLLQMIEKLGKIHALWLMKWTQLFFKDGF